ncbi:MAG: ABC transporter ATP-binding protein [Candidatus Peribacteraceae bacterium]
MRAFLALASALWRYSAGRRWQVVTYALMSVTANIIWLFEPYAVGKILNGVQLSTTLEKPMETIIFYLVMLMILNAGSWLFHGPARVIERQNAFQVRIAFKAYLYSVITSLPIEWQKNNHSGRTINRIGKATNALFQFSQNSWQLIEMVVRPLGALVALILILPEAAVLAVVVSVLSLSIVFIFDRYLLPLYEQVNEKDHHVASALHDYISNIITVITLRLEALTQGELWKRMTVYFPIYRREVRLNEAKWFVATQLIATMTAIVLAWYAWTTLSTGGVLLAGTFFMLYDYLQKIGASFYTFAWKYGEMVEQSADLRSIQPILLADRSLPHDHCQLPKDWKEIEIRSLNFTYRDEEKRSHHLQDIHITLTRGQKIAFIGESGSGKSTMMSLIRGLYDADSGEVRCDGTLLAHGLRDVGTDVTLIPQDPEIFENTIEYNITLDTDQEASEIEEDVRLARFGSVVDRLAKGLKTSTAEKGVNLSGGERQRLALARGFFAAKNRSVILLDEPTSSVDPENEKAIYQNLFTRFPDRCIVSSVHKPYLLSMFDRVYQFADGRVVRSGVPADFL